MTPRTASRPKDKGKGKARAMTADFVSPGGASKQSRAISSLPHLHAQTQTPPLSPPPDFTRDALAFAPAATSTQQQRHAPTRGSQYEIFGLEAHVPRGSGVFGRERDVADAWIQDVPVVEADGDVEADVGADVSVDMDVDVGG